MACSRNMDEKPFGRLDLSRDCKIYFLRTEGEPSDFNKRTGDFFLNDPVQISKLKEGWRLTSEHAPTACGFEYLVYMVQDGSPVGEMSINGPCGYIVTNNGWFDFDKRLYDEIDEARIQHIDERTADSLHIALSALFGP